MTFYLREGNSERDQMSGGREGGGNLNWRLPHVILQIFYCADICNYRSLCNPRLCAVRDQDPYFTIDSGFLCIST